MRIERYRNMLNRQLNELNEAKAERNLLQKQLEEQETKAGGKMERKRQLAEVQALLVNTANDAREVGRKRMENVVTRALQSVFGTDFTFEIEMDESGGKPVARFLVCSIGENGEVIKNEPQESRGGGINDIVAFALQVAVLVVYNEPKIQGPIVLDEPGKHVSEEYAVKFGEFLEFVSKTFNRQIIMVTHQPHLAATAKKTLTSQVIGGKTVIKERKDGSITDELAGEDQEVS